MSSGGEDIEERYDPEGPGPEDRDLLDEESAGCRCPACGAERYDDYSKCPVCGAWATGDDEDPIGGRGAWMAVAAAALAALVLWLLLR